MKPLGGERTTNMSARNAEGQRGAVDAGGVFKQLQRVRVVEVNGAQIWSLVRKMSSDWKNKSERREAVRWSSDSPIGYESLDMS
jgi:hypothetical protein